MYVIRDEAGEPILETHDPVQAIDEFDARGGTDNGYTVDGIGDTSATSDLSDADTLERLREQADKLRQHRAVVEERTARRRQTED